MATEAKEATAPKIELLVLASGVWPGKHLVYHRTRLVGVLACARVARGKGEAWSVLWRRGEDGWVVGDGGPFPDKERAAEAAMGIPA